MSHQAARSTGQELYQPAHQLKLLAGMPAAVPALPAEGHRYEQRFGCLEMLCRPEPMPYDQFRTSTDASGLPPARVLGVAAAACARTAERTGALLSAAQLRALLRDEQARRRSSLPCSALSTCAPAGAPLSPAQQAAPGLGRLSAGAWPETLGATCVHHPPACQGSV